MNTEQTIQEITDLFARFGTGDYMPTDREKELVADGLREILRGHAPGPTGKKPIVRDPRDKGELRTVLTVEPQTKTLRLDFGTPIVFLRMTKDEARHFARGLLDKAKQLP